MYSEALEIVRMCKSCYGLESWCKSYIQKGGNTFRLIHWLGKEKKSLKKAKLFFGTLASKQIYEAKKVGFIMVDWKKDTVKVTMKGRWLYVAASLKIRTVSLLQLSVVYGHMKNEGYYFKPLLNFDSPYVIIPNLKFERSFELLSASGLITKVPNDPRAWTITKDKMELLSKYDEELMQICTHLESGCALLK